MREISERSPFYAKGLRFTCTRCSACCRYEPGFVFLSAVDVSLLGKSMNMEEREFIETYCRWIPGPEGDFQLSLREKTGFDCVFWDGGKESGGCSVYEVRPLQCRAFPFWDSILASTDTWNAGAQECPGINRGEIHSGDSIKKWLALRQNEPIIIKNGKTKGER